MSDLELTQHYQGSVKVMVPKLVVNITSTDLRLQLNLTKNKQNHSDWS